jgi:hypothetical protein
MARDDGTIRERYIAMLEGEIIAARVRLDRARERMREGPNERAEAFASAAQRGLTELESERTRLLAGEPLDGVEAGRVLQRRASRRRN